MSDPSELNELQYEHGTGGSAAQARFLRTTRHAVFWSLAAAAVLLVVFHALLVISEARLRHEPRSIPGLSLAFREADPSMRHFVSTKLSSECIDGDEYLEPVPDEICRGSYLLAAGEHDEFVSLFKENIDIWNDNNRLGRLELVLRTQMLDAISRRDWATCAKFSKTSLRIMDHVDRPPAGTGPTDNMTLLISSACERPAEIFLQQKAYIRLLGHLAEGTHISSLTLEGLVDVPAGTQLDAWHRYLKAMNALRQKQFDEASKLFDDAARRADGTLRDLSLLGKARTIFWRHKLRISQLDLAPESREKTVRALRLVSMMVKRASFKSDIQDYVDQVARQ